MSEKPLVLVADDGSELHLDFRLRQRKAWDRSPQQLICFPNRMSGRQLSAVFLQWANANPQSWNESPEDTVFTAFAKAWPCQVTTGATK